MKLPVAGLLAVSATIAFPPAKASPADPVVAAPAGTVRGLGKGDVDAFLGIPYAKAPIGNLRWRDPQPLAKWQGVRDARAFGTNCYQGVSKPFGPYTAEFLITPPVSEDCLFLNVWTPAKQAAMRPVLVWIHGGGFGSGSGSIPIYDGGGLAKRGVVVVTLNYRLGVFGFLAHEELTKESATHTSGNYGLMDIATALRWVRANIASFGGDPRNVTIMGQSAGAAAVNDLLLSRPAAGLFQHGIAESGSGMGIPAMSLADAERRGADFVEAAGAATIAALRRMPAEAVFAGTGPSPYGAPKISFAPNVDGYALTASPDDAAAPLVTRVPLLTGYNSDEGGQPPSDTVTPATFEQDVRRRYGDFADRVLAVYPHADDLEARASTKTLSRDRYMTSLVVWAEKRERASGTPVYTYLFDHPYPDRRLSGLGSFHTGEVPYVFGVLNQGGRPFTAKDRNVSRTIQDYWLNFSRTGNPNGGGRPAWPDAARTLNRVMKLGDVEGLRPAVSTPQRLAVLKAFAAAGGRLSLF